MTRTIQDIQLDAPFLIGAPGKYILLVKRVEPRNGRFVYELTDVEGRMYSAESANNYPENQPLKCIVTFTIKSSKLVVMTTSICKNQDIIVTQNDEEQTADDVSNLSPAARTAKPNSPFTIIDEIQNNGQKTGAMTEPEIQNLLLQIERGRNNRDASYRCCGQIHHGLYDFRKHLFLCHPDEYKCYFSTVLHRDAPSSVRGVGVGVKNKTKKKKRYSQNDDAYPTRCKGDYFRLIYTPMGNKR